MPLYRSSDLHNKSKAKNKHHLHERLPGSLEEATAEHYQRHTSESATSRSDQTTAHNTRPLLARRRQFAQPAILLGVLIVGGALAAMMFRSHAASLPSTNVAINGTSAGLTFNGIGSISGGGGNSRYFNDYSSTIQNQMDSYLFKPDYGASLQILKVEIGGDTNSTDGAEASIEHTSGAVNCNAGYEWQMMEQAKAMNPNLQLYGLAWGAPGWIGNHSFWSQDMINYLVTWVGCAKQHNLTINYLGGWNERSYNDTWFENLRTALNTAGDQSTQIVAADTYPTTDGGDPVSAWGIANDMASNSTLKNSIAVVGAHDVCDVPTDGLKCLSTSTAQGLGLPLWMSEVGAMDTNAGAPQLIRSILRGYIDAKLTGVITWPIVASMPPGLPHETYGLLTAYQPWSGNYAVGNLTWALAQVTQFTQPGWKYLNSASNYLGGSRSNGSYVTLKSTDNTNWSMVTETSTATSAQNINATVSGGLSSSVVHVWASNLDSSNPSAWFQQLADVTPSNGKFSYTLQPGYIYTFTTTTGQSKGNAGPAPAAAPLSLPYSDTFANLDSSNEANYLATMSGSFEGEPCVTNTSTTCLEQTTPADPIDWSATSVNPYAIIGDSSWANYSVSVNTLFTQAGSSAGVIGRFGIQNGANENEFDGYLFQATDAGGWKLLRNSPIGSPTTLASGTLAALGTNTWHTLTLNMQGSTISASIDGKSVAQVTDATYTAGPAGIDTGAFTNTWPVVQFENLSVNGTNSSARVGFVSAGLANKCLDDLNNGSGNNNSVDLNTCTAEPSQDWTIPGDGTVRINGKCMTTSGGSTANGTSVVISSCNGSGIQQWKIVGDTIQNPTSNNKCLDDPGSTMTNGTKIDIRSCNSSAGQVWSMPN